jgi:hypothetical protein
MKLGRYGEALADAQLAIELEPEGASNWFRQMDALMELAKVAQQEKNAAEEYRRWLQARETVERWRAYVAQQSTAAVDKMKASSDSHFKKMQEYEYATHFSLTLSLSLSHTPTLPRTSRGSTSSRRMAPLGNRSGRRLRRRLRQRQRRRRRRRRWRRRWRWWRTM